MLIDLAYPSLLGLAVTDALDPKLPSEWFHAGSRCDRKTLEKLIAEVPVDVRDDRGRTVLFHAVAPFGGVIDLARWLVEAGADVNVRNAAFENLVDYCYAGVSSALENGLAEQLERFLFSVGFERRGDDAPGRANPDVPSVERRLAVLGSDELDNAELLVCGNALRIWERDVAAHPIAYIDPVADAEFEIDAKLPARAYAAAAGVITPGTIVNEYVEPIAVLLQGRRPPARTTTCLAYFSLYNLFRRRVLGAPGLSPALVVCQALHAESSSERRRTLLDHAIEAARSA